MSDATTPANPTDLVAATPAVLSPEPPIVPTSGTKRAPDDSEVVQRYDWREDLDGIYFLLDDPARDGWQQRSRLTAHIERLEAERDALLAEHEVIEEAYGIETADDGCDCLSCRIIRAHNNAERVIRG